MNLETFELSAIYSVHKITELLGLKCTKLGIKDKLLAHPEFASLISISDTLNNLNISNLAANIPIGRLNDISIPAMTLLTIEGGIYTVITKINDNEVEYWHHKKGLIKISLEEFSKIWNGIILLVEINENSGEDDFKQNKAKETTETIKSIFINVSSLICVIIILSYSLRQFNINNYLNIYTLLLIKTLGAITSAVLVSKSTGLNLYLKYDFCKTSNMINCKEMLNSSKASLFGLITWAEIGLIYFVGTVLSIVIGAAIGKHSVIDVLSLLTLFSIPFTFYSVYNQITIRKLCTLCTFVQILLWLELFNNKYNFENIQIESVFIIFICLFSTGYLITSFIQLLIKSKESLRFEKELKKIKFDKNFIEYFFKNQPKSIQYFDSMEYVTLGSDSATYRVTVVTNLNCAPCAQLHKAIEEGMGNNRNTKFEIIFINSDEQANIVATYILSLKNKDRANALKSWFDIDNREYEKWKKRIKLNVTSEQSSDELIAHRTWCEINDINETPTLFLSNVKIPKIYEVSDIPFLLKSIDHELVV